MKPDASFSSGSSGMNAAASSNWRPARLDGRTKLEMRKIATVKSAVMTAARFPRLSPAPEFAVSPHFDALLGCALCTRDVASDGGSDCGGDCQGEKAGNGQSDSSISRPWHFPTNPYHCWRQRVPRPLALSSQSRVCSSVRCD
jgi:hypothetical protein